MNNRGQVSVWGFIYAIACFVIALMITKAMNPGLVWNVITIVVTTGAGYFFGAKAGGDL